MDAAVGRRVLRTQPKPKPERQPEPRRRTRCEPERASVRLSAAIALALGPSGRELADADGCADRRLSEPFGAAAVIGRSRSASADGVRPSWLALVDQRCRTIVV